jgi:nucleotide-binding universal stress UspA family protein
MFKRLLVPLDGLPESATALPVARAIKGNTSATITLLRAVPSWECDDRAIDHARRYLSGVATALAGTNADVLACGIAQGDDVAKTIVHQARACESDLIVMATHARHGVERVARESVAMQTLHLSPVPVVLVAPGGVSVPRLRTILVPVDGTPAGEAVLEAAVSLARASGGEIVLLRIVVPAPVDEYDPLLGEYAAGDGRIGFDAAALVGAQHYIDDCTSRVRASEVEAQGFAILGGENDAILEFAERVDADLIAMSTHARASIARSVLGSVADSILREARRPVLMVRRDSPSRPYRQEPMAVSATAE